MKFLLVLLLVQICLGFPLVRRDDDTRWTFAVTFPHGSTYTVVVDHIDPSPVHYFAGLNRYVADLFDLYNAFRAVQDHVAQLMTIPGRDDGVDLQTTIEPLNNQLIPVPLIYVLYQHILSGTSPIPVTATFRATFFQGTVEIGRIAVEIVPTPMFIADAVTIEQVGGWIAATCLIGVFNPRRC